MIVWIVRDARTQDYYRIIVDDNNKLRFQKYNDYNDVWNTWENLNKIVNFCDMDYDELLTDKEKCNRC